MLSSTLRWTLPTFSSILPIATMYSVPADGFWVCRRLHPPVPCVETHCQVPPSSLCQTTMKVSKSVPSSQVLKRSCELEMLVL